MFSLLSLSLSPTPSFFPLSFFYLPFLPSPFLSFLSHLLLFLFPFALPVPLLTFFIYPSFLLFPSSPLFLPPTYFPCFSLRICKSIKFWCSLSFLVESHTDHIQISRSMSALQPRYGRFAVQTWFHRFLLWIAADTSAKRLQQKRPLYLLLLSEICPWDHFNLIWRFKLFVKCWNHIPFSELQNNKFFRKSVTHHLINIYRSFLPLECYCGRVNWKG